MKSWKLLSFSPFARVVGYVSHSAVLLYDPSIMHIMLKHNKLWSGVQWFKQKNTTLDKGMLMRSTMRRPCKWHNQSVVKKLGINCSKSSCIRVINKLMFNRQCVRARGRSPGAVGVSKPSYTTNQWVLTCKRHTLCCVILTVINEMKVWPFTIRMCVSGRDLRQLLGGRSTLKQSCWLWALLIRICVL